MVNDSKQSCRCQGVLLEARFASLQWEELSFWGCGGDLHKSRGKLQTGFEENPAGWNGAFYHGNCPPLHKLSCKTSISSPREGLMGHN